MSARRPVDTDLPVPRGTVPEPLKDAFDQAVSYLGAAQAETTKRGYQSDWRGFQSWCRTHQSDPLADGPPEPLVALYVAAQTERLAPATLDRHVRAIAATYRAHGRPFDTRHDLLAAILRGIHRRHGKPAEGKDALPVGDLMSVISLIGNDLRDHRDRALILTGFFGAFRRSELAAIRRDQLIFEPGGLKIILTDSKTDPLHHGQVKALPYQTQASICPVQALQIWLRESQISEGAVFRAVNRHGSVGKTSLRGRSIARIVKQRYEDYLKDLGLGDEVIAARLAVISSHSLRAGFITNAFREGEKQWRIRKLTGHISDQVLETYNRPKDIFTAYPGPVSRHN